MSQLDSYVRRYGPVAGPKLYHAIRSRSAFMGANRRRRATIARLVGPAPTRREGGRPEATPLLPFGVDREPAQALAAEA